MDDPKYTGEELHDNREKRTDESSLYGKHLPRLIDALGILCDLESAGSAELSTGHLQHFLILPLVVRTIKDIA